MIQQSYNALPYLKMGYVLYILDNKAMAYRDEDRITLYHEKWHTKISDDDFLEMFANSSFQLIESKEELDISKEKDDEYYQWRYHHQ